jgi:tetratricopeptide (TPR) repeat protein
MGYAYGHFLLGHCMLKEGRVREADREFQRALSLDSTRAEYYQGYALSLNATGNWPLAVRVTTEGLAREHDPRTRYSLLALRGYAWGALRRWNDAVTDLEAAQRIQSEPWILVFLGKARFATGAYGDAVPPLRRALLSSPEDPAVLRLLAESFLRLAAADPDPVRKRFLYTESLANAQRLASVAPDDLDAVHLVGRAALGAGRFDQAENVFRHVLGKDPRQCYAMANLGRTYMALSRWTDAEAYLRKAAACAPRLSSVYDSLGELYMQVGKPQEAAAAYRRSEELEPTRRDADRSLMVPVFAPR